MTRLENNEFLNAAGELILNSNGESSIYLIQKRLTPANKTKINVESEKISLLTQPPLDTQQYPILIRITDGAKSKKVKYSTIIDVENLNEFWLLYSNILKNGLIGLKKKDKKKKKKNKSQKVKK